MRLPNDFHSFTSTAVTLFLLCASIPRAHASPADPGVSFDDNKMPTLTLPYARIKAKGYDAVNNVYIFKNIPFAAPPQDDLRWTAPQPPVKSESMLDGSHGPQCVQATKPGPFKVLGEALGMQSEDCLYLDVYVPSNALNKPVHKLPVVHWIHGGGYIHGSKDLYPGDMILKTSKNSVIYVASNYRLGAYGFLGGATMEESGLPNAGLWDQRAALNWTQQYISLLGGDPQQVTAFGESAGGGSILHHITAFGGKQNPLFKRAIIQSPAFDIKWDRKGAIERQFQTFLGKAGCSGSDVNCLRKTGKEKLEKANDALVLDLATLRSAFSPVPDGGWVRQSPPLELRSGNHWRGIESVLLSHVKDEASIFTDPRVLTDKQFHDYVDYYFPDRSVADGIERQYPPPEEDKTTYTTQFARLAILLDHSGFVCYVRNAADALAASGTKVWSLVYSVPPAKHGADVVPIFQPPPVLAPKTERAYRDPFRALFVSFAQFGDPNMLTQRLRDEDRARDTVADRLPDPWPQVDNSTDELGAVLEVEAGDFRLINDTQNAQGVCNFWMDVGASVTANGGFAPPDGVLTKDLAPKDMSSKNYGESFLLRCCCTFLCLSVLAGGKWTTTKMGDAMSSADNAQAPPSCKTPSPSLRSTSRRARRPATAARRRSRRRP
ncbi:Alpha/Beta hydrolase protein [Phyllosticta citricarpa]|uniref:Alpha/Beta hydrolase protein n=1 Tax=Phyllosticta citricarpa TaxID=55181 RepID=A0ABR1MLK5_9PEZI